MNTRRLYFIEFSNDGESWTLLSPNGYFKKRAAVESMNYQRGGASGCRWRVACFERRGAKQSPTP